ncbi:MAG TPA: alanine--glyoxylate aminotransferase family protein, partial [Longimicrobiales bacterium]|nr:alanine--glyoxylate aminotransferase family protein [Longimicrobiales bacterium]
MPRTKRKTFGKFFLPGPTEVRPAILEAMTQPMIGHRVPEMEALMGHIQPGLRSVFRTTRPVYVSASSATGLMEGAIRNGARRRVLSLVNGAFSERFFKIAQASGMQADPLEVEWGQIHTAEMLQNALRRGIYDAVTVVHSETSTGALNPIRDLAEVTRAAGDVVLLVDCVSSLAGAPFETDEWGVDFVLTGSQKAFALPPGLAFGVAQLNVLERAKTKTDRGVYFDFLEYEKNIQKNQTPNTPAVSLMYALAAQLDRIREETIEGRWQRHQEMAARTWAWVDDMNRRGVALEIMAPEGHRSPTVTCLRVPSGWTGPRVAAEAKARGFQIATGYGRMREESFRIGHMGDHTMDTLDDLLDVLEEVFKA